MSSVSKSKSKDKTAVKEQKSPSKSSVLANGGNGLPASAYNPLLGTFHNIDTSSTSSAQVCHGNGRFRNIDDSDNQSTHVNEGEYSACNNDARSLESEDQNKEKSSAPTKQEVVPGSDNDKREKIRQKNEKKHQRQKEKRAQELHERCTGYLMSRKLDALAQQLVAMGFSQERATMALILNEGRVEEAVAWLFEAGENSDKDIDQNYDSGNSLKIDISDELAQIAEIEVKFRCSKQEVERAIVTCEGDLEKSREALRSQKQDRPAISPKSEESDDPPTFSNGKISVTSSQSNIRLLQELQPKTNSVSLVPQRRDDKDFNYTNAAVTMGLNPKLVTKAVQPVARDTSSLEWARPPQVVIQPEKRWPVGGECILPHLQVSVPPSKVESHYVSVRNELSNLKLGSLKEPVVMIQRPQSVNTKPAPVTRISSSPPSSGANWYPPSSGAVMSNGVPNTRNPIPTNLTSDQILHPTQYQHQQHQQQQQQQQQAFIRVSSPFDNMGLSLANGLSSRVGPSPTLAPASSLGLFPGLGSAFLSDPISQVDWNANSSLPSCDYTSVDWSLDKSFHPPNPNSSWVGLGSSYSRSDSHMYDSGASAMGVNYGMRPSFSNENGGSVMGLKDNGVASSDASTASFREWTSPFEGKDLFSLPRQYVFSPSL